MLSLPLDEIFACFYATIFHFSPLQSLTFMYSLLPSHPPTPHCWSLFGSKPRKHHSTFLLLSWCSWCEIPQDKITGILAHPPTTSELWCAELFCQLLHASLWGYEGINRGRGEHRREWICSSNRKVTEISQWILYCKTEMATTPIYTFFKVRCLWKGFAQSNETLVL